MLRSVARSLVVALAAAQFGVIEIDWSAKQNADGVQLPVVNVGTPEVPEPRNDATERKLRLLTERRLVAQLASDVERSVIDPLWEHWYGEEGEEARAWIRIAQAHALDEPELAGEAPALQELMQRYPTWAEPINCLATLRFLQNRFTESIELCERVLALKPWHFGAISGIAMCHEKLGNDEAARRWTAAGLPFPLGTAESDAWIARQLEVIDRRLAAITNDAEEGAKGGVVDSGDEEPSYVP